MFVLEKSSYYITVVLNGICMSANVISTISKALSRLPLRANQLLGALIGHISWLTHSSQRRITEANLTICYPGMPLDEVRLLARRSLVETGKQLTESAWIWHRPTDQTLSKHIEVRGQELLSEAIQTGKGVVMISPHLGNWELCILLLSQQHPFTYFYRSPRQQDMGELLVKWRSHLGGKPASLDAAGIRQGLRVLKKGEILGFLPDQEPDQDNGIFAPFFNEPALTMTLLSKIASKNDYPILFCLAERLPKAKGWRLHILPGDAKIASRNLLEATTSLNAGVESCIGLCPEQYLWDYKRFNTLIDGSCRPYR
ncbi:MAG: KDO2-lipid IV(A) lauroyltransferase [Gammaproteobacteria bacterium]|jgi:KDO2-lipid IV(A) lauroyltransferase